MSNPINPEQDLEKDHGSTRHDSPADLTNTSVPATTEPLQYVASDSDRSSSDPEKQGIPEATRSVTQTTTGSSLTVESQNSQSKGGKPWYKQLNPFKSRRTFPVPKQRIVSKEYGASFLSKLSFQWMASLMKVGFWPRMRRQQKLTMISDWISEAIGSKRHLAGQSGEAGRCALRQAKSLFQTPCCARR